MEQVANKPQYVKLKRGKIIYKVRRWMDYTCRVEGKDYSLYIKDIVPATKAEYEAYQSSLNPTP